MIKIVKELFTNIVEKHDVLDPYSKFGVLLIQTNLDKQYANKMAGKPITKEENKKLDEILYLFQKSHVPKYRRTFFIKATLWLVFLSFIGIIAI